MRVLSISLKFYFLILRHSKIFTPIYMFKSSDKVHLFLISWKWKMFKGQNRRLKLKVKLEIFALWAKNLEKRVHSKWLHFEQRLETIRLKLLWFLIFLISILIISIWILLSINSSTLKTYTLFPFLFYCLTLNIVKSQFIVQIVYLPF